MPKLEYLKADDLAGRPASELIEILIAERAARIADATQRDLVESQKPKEPLPDGRGSD